MKNLLTALSILLAGSAVYAQTHVNGYYRQNGTYVQPHYRSNADSNPWNNYSTQGNTNPYTGTTGTVNPCTQNPYAYGCGGN